MNVLATIFLFSIFVILLTKSLVSKRPRLPPGPSSFPLLGNLFLLRTQPHEKLTSLAATYGPIMSLKLGSVLTVVISSSALAKQALTLHADVFSNHFVIDAVYSHGHDHLSVGWLPTSSQQWRSLRKLYGLLFSGPKLESSTECRHLAVVNLAERVKECSFVGSVVDVGQGIRRRLTVLCSKLFKVFDDIIDLRLRRRKETQPSERSDEDALDLILDAMEEEKGISREIVLHMLLLITLIRNYVLAIK
ncbi:hypothetical protein V2J09_005642 [Rumex salicifolius]